MKLIMKYKEYLIITTIALLFLIPQLFYHSMIVGYDWWFHWSRFYEAAMQIKNSTFNYFQSIYAFNQTGRIINAMYGADFAYLHGLLLLIVKSWLKAEIISGFLCIMVAGFSMFKLVRYCRASKSIALFCAILFMATPPIVLYIQDQSFPGWASAFLPLCFIPAIRMIETDKKQINPIFFGGSVALLMSIHTFTTLLYVLAIIPFWIVGVVRSKERMRLILDSFLSVIVALSLAANSFFSMLELRTDSLVMPFPVYDLVSKGSYFSSGMMSRYDFGLIFSFLLIITVILGTTFFTRLSIVNRMILFVGTLFLVISLRYFPWNSLAKIFPVLAGLQFPQRFTAISNVLLILLCGLFAMKFVEKLKGDWHKIFLSILIATAFLSCFWGVNSIMVKAQNWQNDKLTMDGERLIENPNVVRSKFRESDLSEAFKTLRKSIPDYLPQYGEVQDPYQEYSEQIYENSNVVEKSINSKNQLVLTWYSDKKSEVTQLPIFVYQNSTVMMNGRRLTKGAYDQSNIGTLVVKSKAGKNSVVVGYEPTNLFKAGIVLKLITIPSFIVYVVVHFLRNRRLNNVER